MEIKDSNTEKGALAKSLAALRVIANAFNLACPALTHASVLAVRTVIQVALTIITIMKVRKSKNLLAVGPKRSRLISRSLSREESIHFHEAPESTCSR